MLNLMTNEYIKIFHRVGTWVLIIFLALCTAGGQLLVNLTDHFYNDYTYSYADYGYSDLQELYESDLEWLDEAYEDSEKQDPWYIAELERVNFYMENEIDINYYWDSNWQREALDEAFHTFYEGILVGADAADSEKENLTAAMEACKNAVLTNNWKIYYTAMTEYYNSLSTMTAAEKEDATWQFQYYLDKDEEPDMDAWDYQVIVRYLVEKQEVDSYEAELAKGYSIDEEAYETARDNMILFKYRLDNQVEDCIYYDDVWEETVVEGNYFYGMDLSVVLIGLVSVIMIVLAGGIISREFSQGTIKLYLINPVSRRKLFWSKFLTVFSLSAMLTAAVFLASCFFSGLFHGFSGMGADYIYVSNGAVKTYSAFFYIMKRYGCSYVSLFTCMTMAFMISSLLRSSSIAIGLSIAMQFAGSVITSLLSALGLDFGRYLLFANTDLENLADPSYALFPNHTLSFAVTVIVIYMIVFLLTAYDGFTRKEV